MTMRLRARLAWALCGGVLAAIAPSSRAAGPVAPPCDNVAFSPSFAADHTIACTTVILTIGSFSVTKDGGRTWSTVAPIGLPTTFTAAKQVIFSSKYSQDHTIYVDMFGQGLYGTTDGGRTFTAADPASAGQQSFAHAWSPLLLNAPSGAVPATAALANVGVGGVLGLVVPPARVPAAGAAGTNVRVAQAPPGTGRYSGRIYDFAVDASGNLITAYECTLLLACSVPGGSFTGYKIESVGFAPDFGTSGRMWVFARDSTNYKLHAYLSSDAGATFKPWADVEKALAEPKGYGTSTFLYAPQYAAVALEASRPDNLIVRLSQALPRGKGQGWIREAIYTGTFNGRLTLLAANREGQRPQLPLNGTGASGEPIVLFSAPDGTLYTQVPGGPSGLILQRSNDRGRTWHS
jgi:hypothetical protein